MLILCLFLNFEPVVLCFCCKDIAVFVSSNGFPRIPPKLYKTVGGIMDKCGKTPAKPSITLKKTFIYEVIHDDVVRNLLDVKKNLRIFANEQNIVVL